MRWRGVATGTSGSFARRAGSRRSGRPDHAITRSGRIASPCGDNTPARPTRQGTCRADTVPQLESSRATIRGGPRIPPTAPAAAGQDQEDRVAGPVIRSSPGPEWISSTRPQPIATQLCAAKSWPAKSPRRGSQVREEHRHDQKSDRGQAAPTGRRQAEKSDLSTGAQR